jgi:hypothetical protein
MNKECTFYEGSGNQIKRYYLLSFREFEELVNPKPKSKNAKFIIRLKKSVKP